MESNKSTFYNDVYELIKLIPSGRVTSYGAIAKYLGAARSSRLVGWAINQTKTSSQNIPAHRVVNRIGMLSGKMHFGNPNEMESLLKKEGVLVKNDQIQNFDKVFWDPDTELG